MNSRRHALVTVVSIAALTLAGCANSPPQSNRRSGPLCYRNRRNRPVVCTSAATPSLAVEAEAKRFEADSNALTVFVIRSSWGDTRHLITVSVDNADAVETLPRSMIRMRLRPGHHQITFEFEGRQVPIDIQGSAGEVSFLRLGGEFSFWGSSYGWFREPDEAIRRRALKARLVGDLLVL